METYAGAVGRFVARYRQKHSLTLDMVASAGRVFGATWNTASIRNIEAGKFSPTIQSLLILALALGHLSGTSVRLDDLFGDAEAFESPTLSPDGHAPRGWVKGALSGAQILGERPAAVAERPKFRSPAHERAAELEQYRNDLREMGAPASSLRQANALLHEALLDASQEPPDPDDECLVSGPPTLAEERAAKKLGITAPMLQGLAQRLWGQSLEDESLERAGAESSPQKRGIETRRLLQEMREELGIDG